MACEKIKANIKRPDFFFNNACFYSSAAFSCPDRKSLSSHFFERAFLDAFWTAASFFQLICLRWSEVMLKKKEGRGSKKPKAHIRYRQGEKRKQMNLLFSFPKKKEELNVSPDPRL